MLEKIHINIKVPNETCYLGLIGKIGEDLAHTLTRSAVNREVLGYELNTVLTEAMANVIFHANQSDPSRSIEITLSVEGNRIIIRIYDEGHGFEAANRALAAPCTLDDLSERGRGIFIIRSLMDSVTYRRIDGKHVLEMIKTFH